MIDEKSIFYVIKITIINFSVHSGVLRRLFGKILVDQKQLSIRKLSLKICLKCFKFKFFFKFKFLIFSSYV